MRTTQTALIILPMLLPAPAMAHIGHLGEVAGHGHWIALGGIAIAGGIALLGGRKKPAEDNDAEEASEEDPEEAPA